MEPLKQFDPETKPAYFDLDTPDISEQQFAASLEELAKPTFVVDTVEESAVDRVAPPVPKLELEGRAPRRSNASPPISDANSSAIEKGWRDEVSAKISHYKSRKAPKVRYPSLQLQFDPPATRAKQTDEFEPEMCAPTSAMEIPVVRLPSETYVSLEATARIIEFPRPEPVRLDELAEPVLDKPRIVEAPGLVPPPPALGGILIEQIQQPEPDRRPGFDMPLQSAPLSRRLLAGLVDLLIVTTALAAFGYIFLRLNGAIQQPKLLLQLGAVLLTALWPAYQYAFLVFTASTPGLRVTRLAIVRFDGTTVSRSLRRWRVLASLLSCASLGLGYAWCYLDEDQLSWHDRITKTHLAPMNSGVHS